MCTACRRQYTPEGETLRALNINEADAAQFVFYKAVGCEECNGTGYRGRIALYEVMRVSDKVRRLIAQNAGEDMVREAAVDAGMLTLGEDGLAKVKAGITTAEELLRVVTEVREMRTLCSGLRRRRRRGLHGLPALRPPAQRRLRQVRPAAPAGMGVLPVLRHDAGLEVSQEEAA